MTRIRLLVVVLAIAAVTVWPGTRGSMVNGQADIEPQAAAQIEALLREKESRSPVERKIDSQLLYALKMSRGQLFAAGVAMAAPDLPHDAGNRVILDVRGEVTTPLLDGLRGLGARVDLAFPEYRTLRVAAPLAVVDAIAALPDVKFVAPKEQGGGASFRSRVRDALQQFQQISGGGVGSATSQGDTTHRAVNARTNTGMDGTGVKIGLLSDGVNHLAASQAAGDLGAITIVPGQGGNGDEGTAMLEIVHDLAPGAELFFATSANGIASMSSNIRTLRFTYHCDIIIDDWFYFAETPLQDGQASNVFSTSNGGLVIQAVKDVTADGALYFAAAGNEGNLSDGTSGTWEGDFADGGATSSPLPAGTLHSFGAQTFNTITCTCQWGLYLFWADPLAGSGNDYDLFVLDSTGTSIVASSTNFQTGTQDPLESISNTLLATGRRAVVVKKAGAAGRFLHLTNLRGRLAIVTSGEIKGHSSVNSQLAFGVGASPAGAAFPGPFTTNSHTETFSSDGPRRIFFNSNGTAITPGNFSATGGQALNKPDIVAADGVSISIASTFGNGTFFGTSAAAPHAGAIAALIKAANTSMTPTQIRAAMIASAIDIEAPGLDRDSGVGIIMADVAVTLFPPAITSQPADKAIVIDQNATFTAASSGNPAPTWQWQASTDGGSNWTNLSEGAQYTGVFTPSLTAVAPLLETSGTKYRALAINSTGSAVTNVVTLTIALPADGNMVQNGTFFNGRTKWLFFEEPDIVHNSGAGGVFEYHKANPTTTASGQAVIFQNTGQAVAAGAPIVAQFDIGNADTIRKRISVLVIDSDFSDLSVCTFWLPANSPLQTYQMKTHPTKAWANASIYFYAASTGTGNYRLDNVTVKPDAAGSSTRTTCVDPMRPAPTLDPAGPNLLTNGDFSTGLGPWGPFFDLTHQLTGGVFEFIRPGTPGVPAGGILQATNQAMTSGQILSASFKLGNSSGVRKRVTVLLHDGDFLDLSACTFWLAPGQVLSTYAMRSYASKAWTNATLSIYAATTGLEQWTRVDDVTFQTTPAATALGTECLEPPVGTFPIANVGDVAASFAGRDVPHAQLMSIAPASDGWAFGAAGWASGQSRGVWLERVDLTDTTTASLTFSSLLLSRGSTASVQVSEDGVEWTTVAGIPPGDGWATIAADLTVFAGRVIYLRFAFDAVEGDMGAAPDTWHVMHVTIVK